MDRGCHSDLYGYRFDQMGLYSGMVPFDRRPPLYRDLYLQHFQRKEASPGRQKICTQMGTYYYIAEIGSSIRKEIPANPYNLETPHFT